MCESCEEPRWTTWLLFGCSNFEEHPDDAEKGIAVITNDSRTQQVMSVMEERICSLCGAPFETLGEESALTPYLNLDIERFRSSGYAILKDDEITG